MIKNKNRFWTAIVGFFLLFVAVVEASVIMGLLALLLISKGIYPEAIRFILRLMKKCLGGFKMFIYEIFYAAARGIEDARGNNVR